MAGCKRTTPEKRFTAKVDKSGACWLWTAGRTTTGYGQFRLHGRMQKAHRVAWELAHGPIPIGNDHHGVCVLHRCDNPLCVKPDHLFLGTNNDNIADKLGKDRQSKGTTHGGAKLTADDVRAIRADTQKLRIIAKRYGVNETLVSQIRRRKIWTHLL